MKRVEWWVVKIYGSSVDKIDFWEKFKSRRMAEKYVKEDGEDTPFDVVKVTYETVKIPKRTNKPISQ